MRGRLLFALGCSALSNFAVAQFVPKIIGGELTAEWPAIGMLVNASSVVCTGTLIGRTSVLAAAHCFDGPPSQRPTRFLTGAGIGNLSRIHRISQVVQHPDYDDGTGALDVAVVTLTRSAAESPFAVRRDPLNDGIVGTAAIIAGYGQDENGTSGFKRTGAVNIASATQQLLGIDGLPQTCFGDSGGPLFRAPVGEQPLVIGVASTGLESCLTGATFQRVDRVIGFLEEFDDVCFEGDSCTPDPLFTDGFEIEVVPPLPVAGMNDTGITSCADATSGDIEPCVASEHAAQDALHGRDARASVGTLVKVGAGEAGFDFTKISLFGDELPADATLGYEADEWSCTRDNTTGLLWFIPRPDPADALFVGHRFTWYNPQSPDGNAGSQGSSNTCGEFLGTFGRCNTERLITVFVFNAICGGADWRLPSLVELHAISNLQRAVPALDTAYFPHVLPGTGFWTATQFAGDATQSWFVDADSGATLQQSRGVAMPVRLVRGGGLP